MSVESTRAELLALEDSHREDHDGGYRLASALCEYRRRMTPGTEAEWDEVLLGWVRNASAGLWGVALEALAREGNSSAEEALSALLHEPGSPSEWRDYIAHTLIRRGVIDDAVTREAEQGAREMRPMGLPNLAAVLVRVPDVLATAADCIVHAMLEGKHDYVESNIPPFVYAAADSKPELLVRLVDEVWGRDNELGKQLSAMTNRYLAKPFVRKRLGAHTADRLIADLRRTSRGSGSPPDAC